MTQSLLSILKGGIIHDTNVKENLIELIIGRRYDKNAFARSCVLTILAILCDENLIPPIYILNIFNCALERMKDVSSIVRRKALFLFSTIVTIFRSLYSNTDGKFQNEETLNEEIGKMESDRREIMESKLALTERLEEYQETIKEEEEIEKENLIAENKALKRRLEKLDDLQTKLNDYRYFLDETKNVKTLY